MFEIQYQQWAGSGKPRQWKTWQRDIATRAEAETSLAKHQETWPNDSFRIVEK